MQTLPKKSIAANKSNSLTGLVLYEDNAAYVNALTLYAHLATKWGNEIPIQFCWWSLAELSDGDCASAATRDAAKAEIVIIAARPGRDWPEEFKAWIESWSFPRDKRLSAIGALLSPANTGGEICGRQKYLKQVAAVWNLDFLHAPEEASDELTAGPAKNDGTTNYQSDLDFEVDHAADSPYCGING